MPTTSLSKSSFEHELNELVRLRDKVAAAFRPAVEAFLKFANEYSRLHKRVARDPPAVEPLYEVARVVRQDDGEKRLRAAVNRHELTPTSGIRETRRIRQSLSPRREKPVRQERAFR